MTHPDLSVPTEPARPAPDPRDGLVYVMSDETGLAVRVAEATGRPLLLRGEPGSGKSSLAAFIARQRRWRYYEHVVTSRTQARDLLWTYDSVRRLADAEALKDGAALNDYVEPGALWWAFARGPAQRRGAPAGAPLGRPAVEPNAGMNERRSAEHAVVLIDEIDKADPDMPNGLLVPLGSNEFTVTETGTKIRPARHSRRIVVITTNEERALPQAFLRRCVVLWLKLPEDAQAAASWLVTIARAHHPGAFTSANEALARAIAGELIALRADAARQALRAPSTAEFLDAVRACGTLRISVGSDDWARLRDLLLIKPQQPG
jgi:MoxR-like ATPase